MTPLHVDADAWRVAVILMVCGWLSLDPSPLWTWPFIAWIVGAWAAAWVYVALGGNRGDELGQGEGEEDEL